MTLSEFKDEAEGAVIAEGFDAAILGYAYTPGIGERLIYDAQSCIAILVEQGMDQDAAIEYFEFNMEGAFVGEQTPLFLNVFDEEVDDGSI